MGEPLELDELLKMAVDSLYLSIVVDETGCIRHVGRPYAEILGVDSQDVIGQPVNKVIPNTRLLNVIKTGRQELGQIFIMKNGAPTICNRFPIFDKKGKIRGALSTATFHNLDHVAALKAEVDKLRKENHLYQQQLAAFKKMPFSLDDIIGNSLSVQKIKNAIEKAAKTNLTILISGETGTGKEVFANAIHQISSRCFGSFIKVNCAAIPKDLLESELFGYSEGAFSGAAKGGKIGKFEQANNGTILLDEIGELPLALQSKLLRVIQERELERVGGTSTIKLDVRMICCTNRDLEQMVKEGSFRQDLYYRINTMELNIPPLRDRTEDIAPLCSYFTKKINRYHGCCINGISEEVLRHFLNYGWPGNVRELEHVLERACVMSASSVLDVEHFDFFLPRIYRGGSYEEGGTLAERKGRLEKIAIVEALETAKGNKSKAAAALKITRSQFYEKLKKYGIAAGARK